MVKPEGFPDFFVIGAPRCGTTAICRYLSRHPGICFSRPKEPHYFSQVDQLPTVEDLRQDYIDRYFDHRTPDHELVGEGSVSYLLMPESVRKALQFNPAAKFIAIVRNPLTLAPSYHQRMLFLLQEDEPDFEKAWALQAARARGEHIPDTCLNQTLLNYAVGSRLGEQIKNLYSIVDRKQCHVIVFDDFKADPKSTYRSLLEFLEIEDDGQTEFERWYESQMYRSRWLQRMLFIGATRNGTALDALQRRKRKYNKDGSKKRGLVKRIVDLNKVTRRPPPLSPRMATIIREHTRDDNVLLSQLLERDLSFWLDAD